MGLTRYESDAKAISPAVRRFRHLYSVALAAIALLAITGQLVVQHALDQQSDDAEFVNQAGRQRMLSQRLVMLSLADARWAGSPGQPGWEAATTDVIARWQESHRMIVDHAESIPQPALRDSLRTTLTRVEAPMSRMISFAQGLLRTPDDPNIDLSRLMVDQDELLPLLDTAVTQLEQSSKESVATLQWVELGLLALTLLVLAVEAMLVFRPAVDRLQRAMVEVEHQRRQTGKRLESLQHLAAGVAHTFNNLLTSVQGNAEMIQEEARRTGRDATYAEAQIATCRRASNVTSQLLAYSGEGTYDLQMSSLTELAARVVDDFTTDDGPAIELVLDPPMMVAIDRTSIRVAITALMTNAIEAMRRRPGVIRVEVGRATFATPTLMSGPYRVEVPAGEYAFVRVGDQGEGLNAAEVEDMVNPFVSSKFLGRGLGLASVLGIAHGHGGGVTVTSRPGAGSQITIVVPLEPRQHPAPLSRDRASLPIEPR